jgi:lysine biosynthesis protein LysW
MAKRKVDCPQCDGDVTVMPDDKEGDIIECDDCGVPLEILNLDPVEVEYVEDLDDLDEDDEEL